MPKSFTFLVGAFSLKEKSPTITLSSFFSFSADNLTLNGPLFLQFLQSYNFSTSQFFLQFLAYEVVFLYHLRNSTGPKSIFGSVILFFENFFFTERSHLQFFDIFGQNGF